MERVNRALHALPGCFGSRANIEGIQATDLLSMNTMLGATVEVQVVEARNRMHDTWDPDDESPQHRFERQSETLPACLLLNSDSGDAALGVDLKGRHVLSREAAPSFRYSVAPDACTKWDLLAVIPWHLSSVLAGTPRVGSPGVRSARHAAACRDWWRQHGPESDLDTKIDSPSGNAPCRRRGSTSGKSRAYGGGRAALWRYSPWWTRSRAFGGSSEITKRHACQTASRSRPAECVALKPLTVASGAFSRGMPGAPRPSPAPPCCPSFLRHPWRCA